MTTDLSLNRAGATPVTNRRYDAYGVERLDGSQVQEPMTDFCYWAEGGWTGLMT